jgi:hypothetical protein
VKHVIWNEKSDEKLLGPAFRQGINQARARFTSFSDEPVDLPAQGGFDATLRRWVKYFQESFNKAKSPAAAQARAGLKGKLIETGDIDWATRKVLAIDEALATDDAIQIPDGIAVRQSPLTMNEAKAARPGERFIGSAYRVDGLDKLLQKLGLPDKVQEKVSDYRVAPLDEGNFIVPKGHALYGDAQEKSECAALVQCLGVSNTRYWRRGPRVQGMNPSPDPGTVIATLGTGVYLSDYSGQSHVGIFLGQDKSGLWMLDQYVGSTGVVGIRWKAFGARHDEVKLRPLQYVGHAFRREVIDKSGNKIYGQDYRYQTVSKRRNLTSDGSEFYILLDDGKVARRDTAPDLRPTQQQTKQVAKEIVDEIFGPGRDLLGPR